MISDMIFTYHVPKLLDNVRSIGYDLLSEVVVCRNVGHGYTDFGIGLARSQKVERLGFRQVRERQRSDVVVLKIWLLLGSKHYSSASISFGGRARPRQEGENIRLVGLQEVNEDTTIRSQR
jgi:hypothetical protein